MRAVTIFLILISISLSPNAFSHDPECEAAGGITFDDDAGTTSVPVSSGVDQDNFCILTQGLVGVTGKCIPEEKLDYIETTQSSFVLDALWAVTVEMITGWLTLGPGVQRPRGENYRIYDGILNCVFVSGANGGTIGDPPPPGPEEFVATTEEEEEEEEEGGDKPGGGFVPSATSDNSTDEPRGGPDTVPDSY